MSLSALSKKSLLVILAYSPTGLGHLRVTDALYEGLPEIVSPILLGSQDKALGAMHRFMSIHPITRKIFEWGQRGLLEYLVTFTFAYFLHSRTKLLFQQLLTILDERIVIPNTIVVVATHFGLAHQLAHVKETFEKKTNVRMLLFVQVTDDSPQPIWYVPGADMLFVPSHYTKEKLEAFSKTFRLPKVPITVTPYPVSPFLCGRLSPEQLTNRRSQVEKDSKAHIHISFPIPGAAVGTEFAAKLIAGLHKHSERFIFHITAKQAAYTSSFLASLVDQPYVRLHVSPHDRETVTNYETLYKETVISLEITKPSEQTFKALLHPTQKGGSILLFANPVGKQEYDNINFLHRHHLIPAQHVQEILWEKAAKNAVLDTVFGREIKRAAKTWRGLLLPFHSLQSTQFITWCIREGIFTEMMHYTQQGHSDDPHKHEISDTGVTDFWKTVATTLHNPL